MTLGVVGGVGMLSAGLLGGPAIGYEQDYFAKQSLQSSSSAGLRPLLRRRDRKAPIFSCPKSRDWTTPRSATLLGDPREEQRQRAEAQRRHQEPGSQAGRPLHDKDLVALANWWQGGYVPVECKKPDATEKVEAQQPAMCYASKDTGPVTEAQLYGGKMALTWTAVVPAMHGAGLLDPDPLFLEPRRLPGAGAASNTRPTTRSSPAALKGRRTCSGSAASGRRQAADEPPSLGCTPAATPSAAASLRYTRPAWRRAPSPFSAPAPPSACP